MHIEIKLWYSGHNFLILDTLNLTKRLIQKYMERIIVYLPAQ